MLNTCLPLMRDQSLFVLMREFLSFLVSMIFKFLSFPVSLISKFNF